MGGAIVLVGSGEFTSAMEATDRELLVALGRARPRVAIVPTASWPDGEAAFRRWLERGILHFEGLGAEAEGVAIRVRDDAFDDACAQAIGEADLVYLSGGKPEHLLDTLAGTPAGAAIRAVHARGGTIAGCSAGAMVLAAHTPRVGGRRFLRFPLGWRDALALVPSSAVLPHYDAFPARAGAGRSGAAAASPSGGGATAPVIAPGRPSTSPSCPVAPSCPAPPRRPTGRSLTSVDAAETPR